MSQIPKRSRIPLNRIDQFTKSKDTVMRVRDRRWLRLDELPIGKTLAFKLIKEGCIFSVLAAAPGSKRGVRLIDAESFDDYLRSLAQTSEKEAI
jgi:hypothetical protein